MQSSLRPLARIYLHTINVHGELFLSSTKIRNFTSCFKDKVFLDFFYDRVVPNDSTAPDAVQLREEGYNWVSNCGSERNYVRCDDSPIVFQSLTHDGQLTYAGTRLHPFSPSSLLVERSSGYLYHPSPFPPASRRRKLASPTSPYGPYSLLRSSLVLEAFSKSLELDLEGEGKGSLEWDGRRWEIGVLQEREGWKNGGIGTA